MATDQDHTNQSLEEYWHLRSCHFEFLDAGCLLHQPWLFLPRAEISRSPDEQAAKFIAERAQDGRHATSSPRPTCPASLQGPQVMCDPEGLEGIAGFGGFESRDDHWREGSD